jgi:hypothetical protein
MIESLWNRIAAIANVWTFLALVLLFVGFQVFFFTPLGKHYPPGGTFDGRRGFPPESASTILGEFALRGQLDNYEKQEYGDLIFPLVYSLLFAVAIVGLGKSLPVPHALLLLPLFAAIADYTENVCIIRMIRHYRADATVPHTLAVIASGASYTKWGLIFVSLGVVIVLAAWRLAVRPHAKQ